MLRRGALSTKDELLEVCYICLNDFSMAMNWCNRGRSGPTWTLQVSYLKVPGQDKLENYKKGEIEGLEQLSMCIILDELPLWQRYLMCFHKQVETCLLSSLVGGGYF